MTLPSEIVGDFVDQLREERTAGTRPSQLMRYLYDNNIVTVLAGRYFEKAFLHSFRGFFFLPHDDAGAPVDADVDRRLEPVFTKAGDAWRSAPPYPDLLSRRDREVFRALARGRKCHVVVQAVNSHSRPYRGAPGFRPWPAGPLAFSRRSAPNAGLMAADPTDPRLQAALASLLPALSYSDYVAELRAASFTISGPSDGYAISNAAGHLFYPTYRVHGVYDEETRANLWRPPEGETIRRELNLRMGLPLVVHGPRDAWRFRNPEEAGPLRGPRLPVLWFDPIGNVSVLENAESIRRRYRSEGIPWPYTEEAQP